MEYAAHNLCEKTNDDIDCRVVDSTCPEISLFLAIRELKEIEKEGGELFDGEIKRLTDARKEALSKAVSAIYFNDDSDYGTALWGVIEALGGQEAIDLLQGGNESVAYDLYCRTDNEKKAIKREEEE